MKTRIYLIILAAAFLMPANTQAQVGNLLKKKLDKAIITVGKSTGKEVDKEVDKEVNKEVEKEIEAERAKQDTLQPERQPKFNLPNLGLGKVTAKYDENYDFKGLVRMETELYDKGKSTGLKGFIQPFLFCRPPPFDCVERPLLT